MHSLYCAGGYNLFICVCRWFLDCVMCLITVVNVFLSHSEMFSVFAGVFYRICVIMRIMPIYYNISKFLLETIMRIIT